MAVAGARFDDRHGRVLYNALDKPFAAARNEQIQISFKLHKVGCRFARGVRKHLHRICRKSGLFQCGPEAFSDGKIRADGFTAAAKNYGVAAFDA